MTHYETLGIQPTATPDEIRAAARKASSAAHPDREGGSHERMQAINQARDVLLDPERRARYDAGQPDQPDTIEHKAFALLMQMFEAALDADQDPLFAARDAVDSTSKMVHAQIVKAKRMQSQLRQRRGTVKRKSGGENHVELLIERRLRALDDEVARLLEKEEIRKVILRMLDDYEGTPTAPPPQVSLSTLFGAYGSGGFV